MVGAGGRASTLADDTAVLLGLVRVDGLDSSCFIHLTDDAVVNGIPHKVRDLRHSTVPESERGDCLSSTTLSLDYQRTVGTVRGNPEGPLNSAMSVHLIQPPVLADYRLHFNDSMKLNLNTLVLTD